MLLILAGVSISLVVGDNGVLTQATRSSDSTKMGQMREAMGLAISSCQTDYFNAYASNASATYTDYINAGKLNDALEKQGYILCSKSGTTLTKVTSGGSNTYYIAAKPASGDTTSGDCLAVKVTISSGTSVTTKFGEKLDGSDGSGL